MLLTLWSIFPMMCHGVLHLGLWLGVSINGATPLSLDGVSWTILLKLMIWRYPYDFGNLCIFGCSIIIPLNHHYWSPWNRHWFTWNPIKTPWKIQFKAPFNTIHKEIHSWFPWKSPTFFPQTFTPWPRPRHQHQSWKLAEHTVDLNSRCEPNIKDN
jgi:hypothetical protein